MMEYKCGVCGENVKDDLLVFIEHTKGHIIDEIKAKHPDWVQKDGICRKCEDYFRDQMRGKGA